MIIKICDICKKTFKTYPYKKDTAKYCSLKCEYKARKNLDRIKYSIKNLKKIKPKKITKLKEKKCLECGKLFNVWNYEYNKRKYCSLKCAYKNHPNKDNEIIKCACGCGKELLLYDKKRRKRKFILGHSALKKEGNRPSYHDIHDKSIWKKIRKQVYKRDDWTCQICGKSGGVLHAHHKIPYRITEDHSLNNLITLCPSCHSKEENKINILLKDNVWDSYTYLFEMNHWKDYPHYELVC